MAGLNGFRDPVSRSQEYLSFRGSVPLKRISTSGEQSWAVFDTGPAGQGGRPLVCLPPCAGTADVFFKQCLGLSGRGVRVVAVQWPPYWSTQEWCEGFAQLLDRLSLEQVHIFGAALGGFLGQKFAEETRNCPRVASLILCNSFTDTAIFKSEEEAAGLWMLPAVVLKKLVMGGLEAGERPDNAMLQATDFILERLDTLSQSELAARLTLNTAPAHVTPQHVNQLPVTLIDVFDDCALTQLVREDTYKSYPEAKLGHLKTGGNFPYLSRSEEVNLYISIHLRNYENAQ